MADIRREAKAAKQTPLEYMLGVMNDASAEGTRRDRMAVAAAPYVHGKAIEQGKGKRAEEEERARAANTGRFATPAAPKLVINNG